jgi:hypothetical protein
LCSVVSESAIAFALVGEVNAIQAALQELK